MRVHGLHLGQRGAGQRQQVLVNGQVHLARYAHGMALQQQVVGQDAAGQRVFHGHQAGGGGALHHMRYHGREGGTRQQRRLRAEVPAGGYFVETPLETLNGNMAGHFGTCCLVFGAWYSMRIPEFLPYTSFSKKPGNKKGPPLLRWPWVAVVVRWLTRATKGRLLLIEAAVIADS